MKGSATAEAADALAFSVAEARQAVVALCV